MAAKNLIALLGYRNHEDGSLFEATRQRCQLAASIVKQDNDAQIVPTGWYGDDFNKSDRPHGSLLTDYLIECGVDKRRIIQFTRTSRTLEDAAAIRRIAKDLSVATVTIVTSDFHAQRVKYIFNYMLFDFSIRYAFADSNAPESESRILDSDKEAEVSKLALEKKSRIEIPFYTGTNFPDAVYENASLEQKSYDQISYFILSACFLSFVFPYTIFKDMEHFIAIGSLVISAVLIATFFSLYVRTAIWANTARRVMYLIETQWGVPGFSYNIAHNLKPFAIRSSIFAKIVNIGYFKTLSVIIYLMVAAQLLVAAVIVCETVPAVSSRTPTAAPTIAAPSHHRQVKPPPAPSHAGS